MLINPNTGAPTEGATVGGLRWSPRPGGSVIGAEPVNNFNTPGHQFQAMNELIISLDAAYEALPNKASWIEAAIPIADMPVCGCASSKMSGKKLFRLTNYWREMNGMNQIDYPTDPVPGTPANPMIWSRNNGQYWPFCRGWIPNPGSIEQFNAIAQIGLGNENPILRGPINHDSIDFFIQSLECEFWTNAEEGFTFGACLFSADGWPMGVTTMIITH